MFFRSARPARSARTAYSPIPRRWCAGRPTIILGSWCGKRFRPDLVAARPGWETVPAVRDGELHEIKSPLILQPGPAALTDGLSAIHAVVRRWAARG